MILILGGAYQGKLDFALETYKLCYDDVYSCSETNIEVPSGKKIINNLDKWIFALLDSELDANKTIKEFVDKLTNEIVICNDISCGVVPVDEKLRAWRETVGRTLAKLSQEASEVQRLFCGIPTKLK